MSVMTVTDPIDAAELGITMIHEHIFIDLRNQFIEFNDSEQKRISMQKVDNSNLQLLQGNPYAIKDNLLIDDVETAVKEIELSKRAGAQSIVDQTNIGIDRDVSKLKEIAQRTGLNIIAGCGYYTSDTHPAEMDEWSSEYIADIIIRDLTEGIDGTDAKAGIIGEIGTSIPIHPNEKKVLIATAQAHSKTCVAISVHTYPWGKTGLEVADVLIDNGADPAKIVICHIDVKFDLDYIRALLAKGVYVEFDNFGKEFNMETAPQKGGFAGGAFARDIERVQVIKQLLEEGYEKKILIANDVCLKCLLHQYGGPGYYHILCNIPPMMLEQGVSEATIDMFLRQNPQRLLDV